MSFSQYEEVVKILITRLGINYTEIYNYRGDRIELLFQRFFDFCQTNLTERCPYFDIQPALFFYGSDVQVNASAGKQHGHYLIEMNVGLVKKMYGHFYDHNKAFKVDSYLSETYNQLVPEDVYFGETDHPIPWQTDHLNCWRTDAANAVEAFTKIVI